MISTNAKAPSFTAGLQPVTGSVGWPAALPEPPDPPEPPGPPEPPDPVGVDAGEATVVDVEVDVELEVDDDVVVVPD